MVCSLSAGCIANGIQARTEQGEEIVTEWRGTPTADSTRFAISLDPDEQPGAALMWFYLLGCGVVAQGRTRPIRMAGYGEIGA
jgi:hypothetical protein